MKLGILVLLLGSFLAIGTATEYGLEPGEFEHLLDEVYKSTRTTLQEDICMREIWPKFVRFFPETAHLREVEFEFGISPVDYTCQTESKMHPKLGEMMVGSVKYLRDKNLHQIEVYARMLLDDESKRMEFKVVHTNKDSAEGDPPFQVSCTFRGDTVVKLIFTIPNFTTKPRNSITTPACLVTIKSVEVTKLGFPVPSERDPEIMAKLGLLWRKAVFTTTGWQDAMSVGLTEAIVKKANEGGQQQWICTSPEMQASGNAKQHEYSDKYKKYCGKL